MLKILSYKNTSIQFSSATCPHKIYAEKCAIILMEKNNKKLLVNIFLVYVHDFLFSQLGEWVW